MPIKILVVDDDESIRLLLSYNLEKEGYQVQAVGNGEDAVREAGQSDPDLIVLDLMLPGIDGREVCRLLKHNRETAFIPIMMLTAKGEEVDVIVGLELGADDYVTKPFSVKVILARIKALLRRNRAKMDKELSIGPLKISEERHEISLRQKRLDLTAIEFKVLSYLAANIGRVFTRDQLIDRCWSGDAVIGDRTVDVHIRGLRKKLGADAELIQTVRGFGYRMEENGGG